MLYMYSSYFYRRFCQLCIYLSDVTQAVSKRQLLACGTVEFYPQH